MGVYLIEEVKYDDFRKHLKKLGFKFEEREHQIFLARYDKLTVNLYKSGKITFGGDDKIRQEVEWYLSKLGAKMDDPTPGVGLEGRTRIGTDEVGKGDFFGPLVVAGALIDGESEKRLRQIGVKDSKGIKGDKRIIELADGIERILGTGRITVVAINPPKYNQLYAKMGNLNIILGWAHARAIEDLLGKNEVCELAISDQFGDPDYIAGSLMDKGKMIELVQTHKGGRDLAVASASVLARAKFISAMGKMSEKYDFDFPRGASADVVEAAKAFITARGVAPLGEVAKLHFSILDEKR